MSRAKVQRVLVAGGGAVPGRDLLGREGSKNKNFQHLLSGKRSIIFVSEHIIFGSENCRLEIGETKWCPEFGSGGNIFIREVGG